MIDFHSHILPLVDDGSQSISESAELLALLAGQNVDTVFATPHFYATDDTPDAFFERRKSAYQLLRSNHIGAPEVLLGAEVAYFPGVSRMSALCEMRLERTKLLLLEMPIIKWSDYVVSELLELASSREIKPVLAHIERYIDYQHKSVVEKLLDSGILMQANASVFINPKTRRKALKMLKHGKVHFIGSDCHNLTVRPPKIGTAFEIIKKELGSEFLSRIDCFSRSFISL
jgi:protein-tyrosine phosphatase